MINRTVSIEYINQYQQIIFEIYLMNISYIQGIVLNAVRVSNPPCPQESYNLIDFSPFTLASYWADMGVLQHCFSPYFLRGPLTPNSPLENAHSFIRET